MTQWSIDKIEAELREIEEEGAGEFNWTQRLLILIIYLLLRKP
jgi:hypothetical protein